MTSELLASVCQSGKSSLANASLLASRFGKNRRCWKNAFPTAVFESGPVWTKYFLRLSCDPFFQTLVRCRFINCWCLLVFCKQFCARSREMDIWKHKTVFCKLEPQWNNSKRHFAPRTLAVAVIGGQTDIPKWNCQLQFFANWLNNQMTAAFTGKEYQLGKKQKQGFNKKLVGL